MKLHTGDTVVVITGKDKGKTGTILRVMESDNRIVVGGVNMRTRHVKKTFQEAGRIVHYEASIHASNVMLLDPKTKKRTRISYKTDEKGEKKRIATASGEVVVKAKAAKTTKKKSDETKTADAGEAPKKASGFWKRKAGAGDTANVDEPSHMQQDKSIPDQNLHVRKGARGS